MFGIASKFFVDSYELKHDNICKHKLQFSRSSTMSLCHHLCRVPFLCESIYCLFQVIICSKNDLIIYVVNAVMTSSLFNVLKSLGKIFNKFEIKELGMMLTHLYNVQKSY